VSLPVTSVTRPREMWTRLTVDPLADPLAAVLARRAWVTPDRITGLAMTLALASAVSFATGMWRLGGALFIARFFTDCLDGKVARAQGTSSARGAMLDLAADVGGISLVTAALSWRLLRVGAVSDAVPLTFLASLVFYNWALAYRKHLASKLGLGDGGADHQRNVTMPVVSHWVRYCRRLNMSPVPWVLEAEIVVLGLVPLLSTPVWAGRAMVAGVLFYAIANIVNVRRLWRLTEPLERNAR